MKRLFKPTLFKKNFIIIFVCLMVIEGFHVYLDYESGVRELVSYYMNTSEDIQLLDEMANKLNDKDYKDKNFFKEFDEVLKKTRGYSAIVDENGKIIHEKIPNNEYDFLPFMSLILSSNMEYSCQVNLNTLEKESIEKLENYILNSYRDEPNKPIYIEFLGERKSDTEFVSTYLKIGNEVIFGENNSQNAEEYFIEFYRSDKCNYSSYSNSGKSTFTNYDRIYDICREMVNGNYESYSAIGEVGYGFRKVGNDLFTILYINVQGNDDKTENGSLVNVHFTTDCLDMILDSTIRPKKIVYFLAFWMTVGMSFLISYFTTRRIKKINNVTYKIKNNNFDVLLKEKPRDELGELSCSINSMSQQLKQTIEQLNQEIEKVKNLESLRKDFINQFTHEMKTPLGIINGYSELIEESKNEEEVNKYLNIINRETNRVNELIQSMLKLSRLEAKKVELNKQDIDLEESVISIVDEYEVLLMKKNIKVEVNVIQSTINADKKLIGTVIHNFLSNAIKHTDMNHKIIINVDNGVSIFNEGKPIEDDKIENIWYTFVTHDREGSGLGLAICRSILDLHEFKYGVENKENGVIFYFGV